MALHRVVVRDEAGNVVFIEFVTNVRDRDSRIREHRDRGRRPEAATGTMDGFNFIEG